MKYRVNVVPSGFVVVDAENEDEALKMASCAEKDSIVLDDEIEPTFVYEIK